MITMVQPLYVGNAVRLFVAPTAGSVAWKVLRNLTGTFAGHNDAGAFLAYHGNDAVFIDAAGLGNDTLYYYGIFYTADNATWAAGNVRGGTPSAIYQDHTTDVMSFMRDRLEVGLRVECDRGNFQPELGYIQVYTAPPLMDQGLRFPLVTVHLDMEDSADRAIGENISGDDFDAIGFDFEESEGWLANVRLQIIGWSLNSDERIELRKAIRRLVLANFPVFDSYGWLTPNLSQQDTDAISGEYSSPMYQVMSTFTCVAPVRVGGIDGNATTINDVTVRTKNG